MELGRQFDRRQAWLIPVSVLVVSTCQRITNLLLEVCGFHVVDVDDTGLQGRYFRTFRRDVPPSSSRVIES